MSMGGGRPGGGGGVGVVGGSGGVGVGGIVGGGGGVGGARVSGGVQSFIPGCPRASLPFRNGPRRLPLDDTENVATSYFTNTSTRTSAHAALATTSKLSDACGGLVPLVHAENVKRVHHSVYVEQNPHSMNGHYSSALHLQHASRLHDEHLHSHHHVYAGVGDVCRANDLAHQSTGRYVKEHHPSTDTWMQLGALQSISLSDMGSCCPSMFDMTRQQAGLPEQQKTQMMVPRAHRSPLHSRYVTVADG